MTFLLTFMLAGAFPTPDLVPVPVPAELDIRYFVFPEQNRQVKHMLCAKEMKMPLVRAFQCVARKEALLKKRLLKTYGGCYVYRKIAGTDRWSQHAFGLAIDLNVPPNGSRYINLQPPEVVECFKEQGFIWGGDWLNKDYMHYAYPVFEFEG